VGSALLGFGLKGRKGSKAGPEDRLLTSSASTCPTIWAFSQTIRHSETGEAFDSSQMHRQRAH
jgi:hypothetical protein